VKTSTSVVPRVNIDWSMVPATHNDIAAGNAARKDYDLDGPSSDPTPPPPPATAAPTSTVYASSASAVSLPAGSNGHTFSKKYSYSDFLYTKYTRVLTFQNLCQE
jgi:hypothetical protein